MESCRIDLWLKLVCLYRHRSEATEACRGGLVRINGRRAKPSSVVRLGDVVEFQKGHARKVVVLAVPERQASKQEAREMIRDESPPPPPRERDRMSGAAETRERGAGRPTKKERRDLQRIGKRRR